MVAEEDIESYKTMFQTDILRAMATEIQVKLNLGNNNSDSRQLLI